MAIRDRKYCCFCGKDMKGKKNYASPLRESWCCDECNNDYVIPSRFLSYLNQKEREARVSN